MFFDYIMPTAIALGAGYASFFNEFSRRNTFLGLNVVGIMACLLMMINSYYTLVMGRFVYGFIGGLMVTYTPKMMQETIPQDIYIKGWYGASTNFVI